MMSDFYIEDVTDLRGYRGIELEEWASTFGKIDRRVSLTTIRRFIIPWPILQADVLTVFLGLDHSFLSGPPQLYETMVFGGPDDQEICERECRRLDAELTHEIIVEQQRSRSAWAWLRWIIRTGIPHEWREHERAVGARMSHLEEMRAGIEAMKKLPWMPILRNSEIDDD